ncbi:universal stress protein [Starkeya sp. ORNL1]|uniref:universal stress protein n=1 Tax=Starkeya sp. ORNL1 TaxID=2709380 RepID=UPI001464709D|nr:universal stress protein [Starkeya sp. ORNL1]QJP15674.1 universal stress protein [Starkeya sp. ORNL1]
MLANVKSILIGITYDTGEVDKTSSALPYGLSLARQANAHITAQSASVRVTVPHSLVSNLSAGLASAENRRLDALAKAASETARGAATEAGLICTTEHLQLSYADLVESFVARARLNDLAVLDSERSPLSADRGLIEAALFESGRPVIVVPHGVTEFAARRVLVAWDGSARASRAVHDALPFLKAADHVEIVRVTGEKDLSGAISGAEVVPYLETHEVRATMTSLAAEGGDVAETLRRHATDGAFDMIVMGAFVHSWMRQMVLGGVTRSLLDASPVPLFLSY